MKPSRLLLTLAGCLALSVPGFAQDTWKPIGKGLFRECFMHAFYNITEFPELEVEIEESEETPGRYRLVNPYAEYPDFIGSPGCYPGDYYIVVDASDPVHCFVETAPAGYQCGGNEMLIVGSIADDYYNNRYGDWELADKENRCGKLVDGAITFPPASLLSAAWNQSLPWDDDIQWLICNHEGMFRVKLPGAPDLDLTADFLGINDEHTDLKFSVTLGKSVEKALVALVEGDSTEGIAEKIADGSIPSVEITSDGELTFPYVSDGIYTIAVVPYLDGTPRTPFFKTLEINYDESEWRKAGKAYYREGIISGVAEMIPYGFAYPTYEYYVQVEENVAKPGYLRLVDAYGPDCPLSYGYKFDDTHKWYLYIDATNPEKVFIERTEGIGLNLGYGRMDIWSKVDRSRNDEKYFFYGLTEEEMAANNWFGKFSGNEIVFPENSLIFHFPEANPNTWYEANSKGEFLLRFEPGQILGEQAAGVGTIEAAPSDAPAVYYNLDGTIVTGSNPAPGIYIVRKGDKVSKTLIR